MIDDRPEAEAERLLSQITPGEWKVSAMQDNDSVVYIDLPDREQGGASVLFEADWGKPEDAAFVAAAPRLLRALLTALREARAREEQLERSRDHWKHCHGVTADTLEAAERERDTLRVQLAELNAKT